MPEVLPQLALLVGLFFAILGYVAARGTLAIYTHSLGYLLEGLAGILKFSAGKGFAKITVDLGGPVRRLDRKIVTALQTWADGAEIEIGYFLHGNAILWHWMASELDSFAQASAQFGEWLLHIHLPKWAKLLAAAQSPVTLITRLVHDAIAKLLPNVSRLVHTVTHDITHTVTKVISYAPPIHLPRAIDIPRLWHGIDELRHRLGKIERRLTRTEALFGATALSLAMANVLGIGSARCLRKGPIGKVSRALCGLSSNALGDLLGLLADVIIVADVCEVITLLNEGLTVIEGPLADLTGVAGAALCHGDYSEPARMPAVKLYLPPNPAIALSGV